MRNSVLSSLQEDEPEAQGSAVHSELDPNSDDDIEEGEDEEGVKDIIICQFDKVRDHGLEGGEMEVVVC